MKGEHVNMPVSCSGGRGGQGAGGGAWAVLHKGWGTSASGKVSLSKKSG